ncbi:hypothetical protein DE146DRAFT_768209 [Phaeosphaeria sp. MPI-PUGE-AT-0046c]|nr:hypothetical protein DE146DRAFT_768209 [Phaeosphaeria sp. MPI-PUGE-AT-0046c]
MPLSNKRTDTFIPLLQDLRTKLGDNYTFYEECVVAIARAMANQEDTSAWYEQMAWVVEGVKVVEKSHAGVVFLLEQLGSGELVSKDGVPPPSLPHHLQVPSQLPAMHQQRGFVDFLAFTPSPSAYTFQPTPISSPSMGIIIAPEPAPASEENSGSAYSMQHDDPVFFTDPTFKNDINDYFGITADSSNTTCYSMGAHNPFNDDASYEYPENWIARYDPAADDVQTFKDYEKREERDAVEKDNKQKAESERALLQAGDGAVDILSQPILLKFHNFGKSGSRKRKR